MLTILTGDAIEQLRTLPDESVQCCVTSPPYWGLRDYGTAAWEGGEGGCDHQAPAGVSGGQRADRTFTLGEIYKTECGKCGAKRIDSQLGLEKTPEEYVAKMVEIFREVRRVLRRDGTLWLNMGDSYASGEVGRHDKITPGSLVGNDEKWNGRERQSRRLETGLKPKDLCGIPWRLAFALQADGWWLRSDIIWAKPNPMPESVTDRPTKAHEYLFLLTKSANYFYDAEAIKEQQNESQIGRIRNDVIGGASWKERQQHGKGGQYKTTSGSGNNGREMALFSEHGESAKQNGTSREEVRQSAEMARQDQQAIGQLVSRNKRSVWTVATAPYPEAHFATYPPDLIKPCIMAGTSAQGCCTKCGAPWERIVESFKPESNYVQRKDSVEDYVGSPMYRGGTHNSGLADNAFRQNKTLGWHPTSLRSGAMKDCNCEEHPVIPCTVLDPFAGSGTTGAVALELGRKAILIELNPKYVALIRQRCDITPGLQLA